MLYFNINVLTCLNVSMLVCLDESQHLKICSIGRLKFELLMEKHFKDFFIRLISFKAKAIKTRQTTKGKTGTAALNGKTGVNASLDQATWGSLITLICGEAAASACTAISCCTVTFPKFKLKQLAGWFKFKGKASWTKLEPKLSSKEQLAKLFLSCPITTVLFWVLATILIETVSVGVEAFFEAKAGFSFFTKRPGWFSKTSPAISRKIELFFSIFFTIYKSLSYQNYSTKFA